MYEQIITEQIVIVFFLHNNKFQSRLGHFVVNLYNYFTVKFALNIALFHLANRAIGGASG